MQSDDYNKFWEEHENERRKKGLWRSLAAAILAIQTLAVNQTIVDQEKYWQAADVPVDSEAKMPAMGGSAEITAVQLMGKSYDDPMWEDLLDRISFDEMQYFLRVGGYRTSAIPSVAFNAIGDQDGPAGISATRIGGTWTGASKPLLTEVLRNEWGCVGRVLSDYIGSDVCKSYVSIYGGLYAGNDQRLNTNEGFFPLADAEKNPTIVNLMRNATHRVLYSAINSAGMNGTGADTRVVQIVPQWRALLC